jgi:glycine/D-amino acid oxidase-like deaminating enzyme
MKISHEPTWIGARQKAHRKIEGDVTADVAIIGGGLTGLLTAYLLVKNGKKVAVLEAGTLGSGATAYTTAFITQVIDTSLSDLTKLFGAKTAQRIWQAGQHAIETIETIVKKEKIDCEFQRCSARVCASSEKDYKKLENEHAAAERLRFATSLVKKNTLPFEQYGFLEVKDQAKFHPLKFLSGLAEIVAASGGKIFEHSRALSLKEGPGRVTVKMAAGRVTAKDVIVATYAPFNNPRIGKYKKGMYSSYVFEVRLPEGIFTEGLYWDTESPYHYFRIDRRGTFDRMIVGGEDHRSELPVSTKKKFDALHEYLAGFLGGRSYEILRKWIGAVLEPVGGLPLIGAYKPHQFVATGFSGNGMTYAMVSALIFRDLILGQKNPWIYVFDRNLPQRRNTSNPRRRNEAAVLGRRRAMP